MTEQSVSVEAVGSVKEFDATREAVVQAHNLTKRFDDLVAVQDLSFEIEPGVIFGLIGPSGSGKTTTVRMLTGIFPPTEGDVTVLGYHPRDFPRSIREKIGYMPQHFFLYPQLTVWENMNFMASLYGMNLFRRKILGELLEFVELNGHERKKVGDLSGGMKRRLSLAATLVQNPTLIFLDEPTAGIDPVLRRKFWSHFQGLKEQGKTMVVTTQYVGEVAYCDLVGVMDQGRMIMLDTPAGIRHRTYGGEMIDIVTVDPLDYSQVAELERQADVKQRLLLEGNHVRVLVEEASESMPELLRWLQDRGIEVQTMEEYLPPFDDVFVDLIQNVDVIHQKENNV